MQIHPTALVAPGTKIGPGTIIGPGVVIESSVQIGSNNRIMQGVFIGEGTSIGDENHIHMNAVIGHIPQDLAYQGASSFTQIGHHNVIREFVTIHRGTKEGTSTVIGNHNFLMAYTHVAHNCQLGDKIIMVNQASLTGHCIVENQAFLSGMTGFHQHSRIGRLAMVSALSACNKDIPPYIICGGRPAVALGVNVVGMRRAGFSTQTREEVKKAFKYLYRSGLNVSQALSEIRSTLHSPEVLHMVSFIEASKRGILDGHSKDTLLAKKTSSFSEDSEISEILF